LNSLMTGVLKYRNLKKEIKRKTALNWIEIQLRLKSLIGA
jgi:hypothetical protein